MAKRPVVSKKPEAETPCECKKQLVEAIVAVRHLQDFIQENGGLEKALAAVARVSELVKVTGGFDQLKEALEIVGKEPAPAAIEA